MLNNFYKNKILTEICKKNIVEYLIENNIHASPKCMENITDNLPKLFKFEAKVLVNTYLSLILVKNI